MPASAEIYRQIQANRKKQEDNKVLESMGRYYTERIFDDARTVLVVYGEGTRGHTPTVKWQTKDVSIELSDRTLHRVYFIGYQEPLPELENKPIDKLIDQFYPFSRIICYEIQQHIAGSHEEPLFFLQKDSVLLAGSDTPTIKDWELEFVQNSIQLASNALHDLTPRPSAG